MVLAVTTTEVVPEVVSSGTTIVTQDIGDGSRPPALSLVTLDSNEPTTIVIADEAPAVVNTSETVAGTLVNTTDPLAATVVEINEAGVPGPPGIQGSVGPQGGVGPAGGGAEGMTFTQDMPSTEWIIPHGWTHWPSATVWDSAGNEIKIEIYQAPGATTIRTVLATAGRAYLI